MHDNADKLFVVKVDLGDEERQMVAGIRGSYEADELVGKKVIVVSNLEPAVIRGEESQGMILARFKEGVPQANGDIQVEPVFDVAHVGSVIAYMAALPLDTNVQFMTIMATKMPYVGRG